MLSTDGEGNVSKRSLRADQEFDFKMDCLFWKNHITEREKRANKAYQVMCKNREFDSNILKVLRVWKGREDLDPELWGWVVKGSKLFPVYTSKPSAPASLLKLFRCNCKKECKNARCICFKNGRRCSGMCGECRGVSCLNCQDSSEIENDDIMDEM